MSDDCDCGSCDCDCCGTSRSRGSHNDSEELNCCCCCDDCPCCRCLACMCDTDSQFHKDHCNLLCKLESLGEFFWWCFLCDDCDNDALRTSADSGGSPLSQAIDVMISRDIAQQQLSSIPSPHWLKNDFVGMHLFDNGVRCFAKRLVKFFTCNEPQGLLQPPLPATMKQPLNTDPIPCRCLVSEID